MMETIKISPKEFALHIALIGIVAFGAGFYIGYDSHSLSLFNLADNYFIGNLIAYEEGTIYGKTDCWERAFILSAWLPFELTQGLQVQDCQEIEWLDNKFQKLYFEPSLLKQSGNGDEKW